MNTTKTDGNHHPMQVRILLDRSGSMSSRWAETLVALRAYVVDLASAKETADSVVSVVAFDANDGTEIVPVWPAGPAGVLARSGMETAVVPRGMTPLYDAVVRSCTALEKDCGLPGDLPAPVVGLQRPWAYPGTKHPPRPQPRGIWPGASPFPPSPIHPNPTGPSWSTIPNSIANTTAGNAAGVAGTPPLSVDPSHGAEYSAGDAGAPPFGAPGWVSPLGGSPSAESAEPSGAGTPPLSAASPAGSERLPGSDRKAILVIITDGEENASRAYDRAAARAAADRLRARGWQVVNLGVEFDAMEQSASIGTSSSATLGSITAGAYMAATLAVGRESRLYASGVSGVRGMSFTDEDRAAVRAKKPST